MILDRLSSASTYSKLAPALVRALDHLAVTDWSACAEGRHDVDGDRLFALVTDYQTRPDAAVPWEAHRRYIDVQYVHRGVERIGHAHLSRLACGVYDADRDLVSASGRGAFVTLEAGTFAIFWPHDAHRPGVALEAPAPVRKVVIKVGVSTVEVS
jgi:YhcH/YjgK/YiaL family protein